MRLFTLGILGGILITALVMSYLLMIGVQR